MSGRYRAGMVVLLVVSLFAQMLPAPVFAQVDRPGLGIFPTPPDEPASPVAPLPIVVAPVEDSLLPSLVLHLTTTPELVGPGDLVTTTLEVINQSPHPAEGLVVTLPLPTATEGADKNATQTGWAWDLGTLKGESRTVLTATLRLTAMPVGRAIVLRAEAMAKGLMEPVGVVGGTLVTDDRGALSPTVSDTAPASDPATLLPTTARGLTTPGADAAAGVVPPTPILPEARFTPGRPTTLTSRDGQVQVQFPADAADIPLSLTFTTRAEQVQRAKVRGESVPPAIAGFRRGFGAFFLDAIDAKNQPVHQFKTLLTVTVRFTPQQLTALGTAPGDLSIFWFDETKVVSRTDKTIFQGDWVALPTSIDTERGIATFQVDHFSAFQLSDSSSPSAAFLPSLQGWQVSGFTGASSFNYPIEVPAGPAGIKPSLNLSYSSAATDGSSGMRAKQQSSWVGKGWSLDTGSIAVNKIQYSSSSTVDHYALSFNGRSYDLMRGEARIVSPNPNDPTHWVWRPTDESYIRVLVENAPQLSGRGGFEGSTPYQRHKWLVWDADGTRYEFGEDVWWGWNRCNNSGNGEFAYMEASRWLLSKVVDTHGNAIDYAYGRSSITYPDTCFQVEGTVDVDIWPSTITWAGGRYQVEFVSYGDRTNDTQYDIPEYQYGDAAHETRRLAAIKIKSMQASSWELVHQYNLSHDYQLYSDARVCINEPSCTTWSTETAHRKLTLTGVQRIGNDGSSALPVTTFSYLTSGGVAQRPVGGWNRLTGMNNGQGGTLSLSYDNIALAVNNSLFDNRHRVTSKTATDGRGNSYASTYSYGTPAVNFLGTNLGDGLSTNAHPNSAVLYYNKYANYPYNSESWLVHPLWKEFRGHATMTETAPDGSQTKHYYYQGDVGCTPNAGVAQGSHNAVIADPCFTQLRDREVLKGREYKTEQLGVGGSPVLASTEHTFGVAFMDYSWAPLSGLWRAFSYESETNEKLWQGSTSSSKRTEYAYNPSCTANSVQAYGNLGCIKEYDDSGALVRKTLRYHVTRDDSGSYITNRVWGEAIYDSSNTLIALTHRLYDSISTLNSIGTKGELHLERRYYSLPSNAQSVTIYGQDTRFEYDPTTGNQIKVTTYSGPGNTYNSTVSAPGGGSTARTTTTVYDPTFQALPTSVTNPLNHVETATYDYRMGTLIKVVGPNGGASVNCAASSYSIPASSEITCARYDVFGRMSQLVRPGDSTTYPTTYVVYYDSELPFRYAIVQREQAGTGSERVSQLFYDGMGRQIQTKAESNGQTQNIVTDTRYDGLGRTTQQSQPRYVSQTSTSFYQYTSPSTDPNVMRWTTTTYDALGRASTITAPDTNSVTTHRYGVVQDGANWVRWHDVVDAERHRTQQRFDSLGRLRAAQEISGNCGESGFPCTGLYTQPWAVYATTRYAYSPLDLLTSAVDANNNTTSMGYDTLGRKTSMSDPDMGSWSYSYDINGNLTRQTDAKGQRICFYYDALDRLTGKHQRGDSNCPSTASGLYASYRYDTYPGVTIANGIGRRTRAETTGGATADTWYYDARGRVTQADHAVGALGGTRSMQWTYDTADRVTTLTYPTQDPEVVAYTYDSAWRQTSVCLNGTIYCFASNTSYTALNQPLQQTFGNGLLQSQIYGTNLAQLTVLRVGTSVSLGQYFHREYSYDKVGNLKTQANPLGQNQSYSYDHRDRLTDWTLGSTLQSYAYDTIGNVTSKGGSSITYGANGNGTGAGPHQARTISGQPFGYDANGNQASGPGRTITWNVENMPISATNAGVSESYTYNADGQRVTRTSGGVTTVYIEGLWEENANTGAFKKYFTLNGQPVAIRTGTGGTSSLDYLHGDHLGSMGLSTNANGTAATAQEFDPWGSVISGGNSITTRNYTGQHLDATGFLFYNARYYDPNLGRFLSADTIVPSITAGSDGAAASLGRDDNAALRPLTVDFHEVDVATEIAFENRFVSSKGFWFQLKQDQDRQDAKWQWGPQNAQTLNRYTYVLNNPLRYIDPTGHQATAPVDLGNGWYARVDEFNIRGNAYHEVHVYRMENGRLAEKGVFGREGWISRHGWKGQSGLLEGMSRRNFDRLNAVNVDAMQRQGTLPREWRSYRYLPESQRPSWARASTPNTSGSNGGGSRGPRGGGGMGRFKFWMQ